MKQLFLVLLVLAFTFFGGLKISFAQNPGREQFNQVYQAYTLKAEEYDKAHQDYILAKTQYEKFKTLTSKSNAQTATAIMLQKRDDVVTYYLNAVKVKINDSSVEITDDKKNSLFTAIDGEISWFNSHRDGISQDNSLEDLIIKSNEARARFINLNYLIYDSLYQISDGKMVRYRARFNDFFNQLNDLINKIKGENRADYKLSDQKIQVIDRWIAETQVKLAGSDTELANARNFASKMKTGSDNKGIYQNAVNSLTKSSTLLKDALSYTKEIIREIKVAEE